ncbi:MAG: single-stranded-DNA-specific exonuclease RecJ [Candidatus Vogelbacteria bacterium]|nr:single-stranded-DNA-specific exonuclease RecJ [Candidatus Vogelbacteria bacterium]
MEQYPELLRTLLRNRGISTVEDAERFLNPIYERDLHDPFLIAGMDLAVERIIRAISSGEKIVVYADYDCDGIPGGVVLNDFFEKIGYSNFSVYIPHRYAEGYGLNAEAVEKFAAEGVTLVITVDNGITDVAEVALAESLGINVILTDHHLPGPELPPAFAILNSKQEKDAYPYPMLCGAGVAFKLVQALLKTGRFDVPAGWEKWLLDAVGISTVADMVPLDGENRALAYFGLKVLRQTRRPGLLQLFRKIRLSPDTLSEENIGFDIGPRINAASRLGEPKNGFRLLATRDVVEAGALADYLEEKNALRKTLVKDIIAEAIADMNADDPIIVVGRPSWLPGIAGLVASRLAEEFGRSAFVWGAEGAPHGKGSCRSDGTVNMVSFMQSAEAGTFLDFGGHEASGGFSISDAEAPLLRERLLRAYERVDKKGTKNSGIEPDCDLSIDEVNEKIYALVSRLAPFGVGNPRPLFRFPELRVLRAEVFGKAGNHTKLVFQKSNGQRVSAIRFFSPPTVRAGDTIKLLAHLEKSFFGKTPELRLRISSFSEV